jgi:hypothetical protein
MLQKIKRTAKESINSALKATGFEIVKKANNNSHNWEDVKQFIPFKETIEKARAAGLSVGDYIDTKHNVPGATHDTHKRLVALGVFDGPIKSLCEIGPGSGRYLEQSLKSAKPSHCEIYETAGDWADWLVSTYQVKALPTDGRSLSSTPANSIDLIQAHKVFTTINFITTCGYFIEIARVVKPGGWVVFDVMTEDCVDKTTLDLWLKTHRTGGSPYPAIMPHKFVIDFFNDNGFALIGSFPVVMKPGKARCLVFRRQQPAHV